MLRPDAARRRTATATAPRGRSIEREPFEKLVDELLKSQLEGPRRRCAGWTTSARTRSSPARCSCDELFRRLKLRRIHLCGSALREGILLDYLVATPAGPGDPPRGPRPAAAQRARPGAALRLAQDAQRAGRAR